MDLQEEALAARADAELCTLVSRCFLRPTLVFSKQVQSGEIAAQFQAILGGHPSDGVATAVATLLEYSQESANMAENDARLLLETDYNRLFVGPGMLLAVPYESFYKTAKGEDGRGRLRGPSEREVAACYAASGLQLADCDAEFADHIAAELAFLGQLANVEADAWDSGDEERALESRNSADEFRVAHPASWFSEFADNIANGAHHSFYPAVATIAKAAVLGL